MFSPESYHIAITFLPRFLGVVYFFAFGAFIFQIKGLLGSNGILPITTFLTSIKAHYPDKYWRLIPTLFWINSSDRALMALVWTGTLLSFLLIFGVYPSLILFLLYFLYLSIVSAGQEFLSFGWEGFLLECTINAFFLSLTTTPNIMVWISINVLLMRFHFQAGIVKLQSKDPNWKNLTALAYHYLSQPIPNAIAWYVHKFPLWFHKLSTLAMFIVELIVPFAIFGNEWMRLGVFIAFFGLQWTIWITGNFSYLNHLTVALSTILVADVYLVPFITLPQPLAASPLWLEILCACIGTILLILQLAQLSQHFTSKSILGSILDKLHHFHAINRYGIFAVMTTDRYEVVFEGSRDGVDWNEYTFFYKPSEVIKKPPRISPYQPRLDWQVWFLPLGYHYRHEAWLGNFIYHLLQGTPEVLKLINHNPFQEMPPKYVRAVAYKYVFSTKEEKKESGIWWTREYQGIFSRPVGLGTVQQ